MTNFFYFASFLNITKAYMTGRHKGLPVIITLSLLINVFNSKSTLFPMQTEYDAQAVLNNLQNSIADANEDINMFLAKGYEAYLKSSEAINLAREVRAELDGTDQARADFLRNKRIQDVKDKIEIDRAAIEEGVRQGIYVAPVTERWKNIKEILADTKLSIKIVSAIVVILLCYYSIPALINYITQPRVISETSRTGWFNWGQSEQKVNLNDLIFSPNLQRQLIDLLLRIKTAKTYDERLPNLLFSGAPGTGKTAFAKALAYDSGFDYALTSGSEFAKITDLSVANNELRNLLNWAKDSENGLIIFIDEAESLFANKKIPTTPKATQDLINTFLSLIPDQSQKNVMFILSTNHPFKLDDAVANRMGINIEFTLPGELEREKILSQYLTKFAQEKSDAIVDIHPEIKQMLPQYAKNIEGLSPRAIKFIAEEMIIRARRQNSRLLTDEIAQISLNEAKQTLQRDQQRDKERDQWLAAASAR